MKKQWVRGLLWILTVGLMVVIFSFSSQNGSTSMATSAVIAVPITDAISAGRGGLPPSEYQTLLLDVQLVVRKVAHFSEYALLGTLMFLLLLTYPVRGTRGWAWLGATLYAATDEVHQLFTGERTGMWQDVLLDSLGALTGVLAAWVVIGFLRARRRKAGKK